MTLKNNKIRTKYNHILEKTTGCVDDQILNFLTPNEFSFISHWRVDEWVSTTLLIITCTSCEIHFNAWFYLCSKKWLWHQCSCWQFRLLLPVFRKKIFRIPYEQQYVLFTYLMYYVIKIHFYLFSEECEIDSHLQFTRNCRYNSDDRIFSTSKGAVVWIFSLHRHCQSSSQCFAL